MVDKQLSNTRFCTCNWFSSPYGSARIILRTFYIPIFLRHQYHCIIYNDGYVYPATSSSIKRSSSRSTGKSDFQCQHTRATILVTCFHTTRANTLPVLFLTPIECLRVKTHEPSSHAFHHSHPPPVKKRVIKLWLSSL